MSEELGNETGGISHVRLLSHLLKRDLNISLEDVKPNVATETFIRTIDEGMTKSAWYALGQAYALEASATPELARIVAIALNACAGREMVSLTSHSHTKLAPLHTAAEAFAMSFDRWINMHVECFEVGHRDRLREKILQIPMDPTAIAEFTEGFRHVLDRMDAWWEALSVCAAK